MILRQARVAGAQWKIKCARVARDESVERDERKGKGELPSLSARPISRFPDPF